MDPDSLDLLRHSLPSSPPPAPPPPRIAGPSSSSAAPLTHLPLILPDGRSISLLDPSPFEPLAFNTRLPATHSTILRAAAKSLFLPPFHQGSQKDRVIKELAVYLSLALPRVRKFIGEEEKKAAALVEKERVEKEKEKGKEKKKGKGKAKTGSGKGGKGKGRGEAEGMDEVEVVVEVEEMPKKKKRKTIEKDLPCLGGAYSPSASSSAALLPAHSSSSFSPIPVDRTNSPFLLYSYDPVTQEIEVSDVKTLLADLLPPQPPQPQQRPFDIIDEFSSSSQSNVTADLIDYEASCEGSLIPVGTLIFDPNASSDLVVAEQQHQPESNASTTMRDELTNSLSFLIPGPGPPNCLPVEPQNDLPSFPSSDGGLESVQSMEPFSQNQAAVGFERINSSSPLRFSFDLPSPTSGSDMQQQQHEQIGSEFTSLLLPSPSIKPAVIVEGGGEQDVEMLDLGEAVVERSSVGGAGMEMDTEGVASAEKELGVQIEPIPSGPQPVRTTIKPTARRSRTLPPSSELLPSPNHQSLQPFRSQPLARKRPLSPTSSSSTTWTRTPSFLPSNVPILDGVKSSPSSKKPSLETSAVPIEESQQEQEDEDTMWSLDGTLVVVKVLLE